MKDARQFQSEMIEEQGMEAMRGAKQCWLLCACLLAVQLGLDRASDASPLSADDLSALAQRKFVQGDMAGTAEASVLAVKTHPNSPQAWALRALFYLSQQQFAKALSDTDMLIRLAPKHPMSFLLRGYALNGIGKREEGLAMLRRAMELAPDSDEMAGMVSLVLASAHMHRQALDVLNKFLERHPASYSALVQRAINFNSLEQYELARNDAVKASGLHPHHAEAWLLRGLSAFNMGDDDTALRDFSKLKEISPNDYHAYLYQGRILFRNGRYEEAAENLSGALAVFNGRDPMERLLALGARGHCYYNLRRYQEALSDVDTVLGARGHLTAKMVRRAYISRGNTNMRLGRYSQAARDFSEAMNYGAGNCYAVLKHRGLALARMGNQSAALADLNRAITIQPLAPDGYEARAMVYRQMGRKKLAKKDLEEANSLRVIAR